MYVLGENSILYVEIYLEGIMKVKTIILFSAAIIIFISCDDKGPSPLPDFTVKVIDDQGQSLEGAFIEGGIDWDHFRVATDSRGKAVVPGHARNNRVIIFKNNYFSIYENYLVPDDYVLTPTPFILTEIGSLEGDAVWFKSGRIITVTYQGAYHVYSYDDNGVSEIASAQLPPGARNFQLYGDTLWYASHDEGIYAFSLDDTFNPQQLLHLNISGVIWPYARKDTIIAVGSYFGSGSIRVFSHDWQSDFTPLDSIGDFLVRKMKFISDYLIIIGNYYNLPTIFNLRDPTDIRLAYNGDNPEYNFGFFHGDTLVLRSTHGNAWYGHGYLEIDLSDPANPSDLDGFTARGRIEDIADDSTAVGRYYYHDSALSVFRRNSQGDFETIAIVSEFYGHREHHGCNPPYFIIGDRLWKMEER